MPAAGSTNKSDERRKVVTEAAVFCFARKGFYGTTTQEIAERASISQPYMYRLFPNKHALFVAAVGHVSEALTRALHSHAEAVRRAPRGEALRVLSLAYASLIEDRNVMRFLMQANCAADEPAIREAVRACYATQVVAVTTLLGGDEAQVRAWFAAGMLDNVVAVLGLAELDEGWARILRGA